MRGSARIYVVMMVQFVLKVEKLSHLMSVPLRNERKRGLAGMQRDKAPVKWPRSVGGGTRLRDRCLDGCYGNRRHREALCIVTLAEASGGGEGKAGRQRTRGMKGEGGNE